MGTEKGEWWLSLRGCPSPPTTGGTCTDLYWRLKGLETSPGTSVYRSTCFVTTLEASDMMLSLGGNTNLVMISRPYYKSNAELMCPLEAYRLLCEPIRYRF
jgi:hypothetical protein